MLNIKKQSTINDVISSLELHKNDRIKHLKTATERNSVLKLKRQFLFEHKIVDTTCFEIETLKTSDKIIVKYDSTIKKIEECKQFFIEKHNQSTNNSKIGEEKIEVLEKISEDCKELEKKIAFVQLDNIRLNKKIVEDKKEMRSMGY